jgi:hypothetical protein
MSSRVSSARSSGFDVEAPDMVRVLVARALEMFCHSLLGVAFVRGAGKFVLVATARSPA